MMKIFRADQVREADAYTIKHEPISSLDLMERAAAKLFDWVLNKYSKQKKFAILVGPGNNGGDGLVLARLLYNANYKIEVFNLAFSNTYSPDFITNKERLEQLDSSIIKVWKHQDLSNFDIVIDAIFGSGLSRSIESNLAHTIAEINKFSKDIVAIDIPSGLFGENNAQNNKLNIVKATYTLTFQFPKLAFMLPENANYVGEFVLLDIGIHKDYIAQTESHYYLSHKEDISETLFNRKRFSHKGTYGHALVFAGSEGKMGASILTNKACLRSGIGLLTTLVQDNLMPILQIATAETMCLSIKEISKIDCSTYSTIALGPGIGQLEKSLDILKHLISNYSNAMVFDADALNLLAANPNLLEKIPKNSIFTPHPKELERLIGKTDDNYSRLYKTQEFAQKYQVYILIKGAFSVIVSPQGAFYFNPTGNPGMATAGSGDVLTGIITAFLSQGLSSFEALRTAVYIHGSAGDIAKEKYGELSLIASDIIENIPTAIKSLTS